ncbi:MAG: LysR family transcriptional regulator [Cryobacterium sp.]|nr:LysR family transcriptional regulator [Oligoflexia bacterium]
METLNYHHLYYFWTVCKEGGFTKASQKMRLSQSAVSEQVSKLEATFGQKLITRTTRSFELTEAGGTALKFAETIFSAGTELMDFMKHRQSFKKQNIRIGALGSLSRNLQAKFLAPILDREDVQFSVTVGDSKRLIKLLRDHALDIVLSTFSATEEESSELYTHLLTHSPLCLVSSKSLKIKKTDKVEDILSHNRIFLPSSSLESRSDFDHYIESNDIQMNIAGELDDIALLRILALTGKGLVVIPLLGVVNDIATGSLVVVHEFKSIKQRFYAITRQKKFPNPIINDLVRSFR